MPVQHDLRQGTLIREDQMRGSNIITAAAMLVIGTGIATTQTFTKLDGSYLMWGKTLIDPPENEKVDRVILDITGRAAKEMFDAMPGVGARPECGARTAGALPRSKTSGGLRCTQIATANFQCSVAIVLATGATAIGEDPC